MISTGYRWWQGPSPSHFIKSYSCFASLLLFGVHLLTICFLNVALTPLNPDGWRVNTNVFWAADSHATSFQLPCSLRKTYINRNVALGFWLHTVLKALRVLRPDWGWKQYLLMLSGLKTTTLASVPCWMLCYSVFSVTYSCGNFKKKQKTEVLLGGPQEALLKEQSK